MIQEFADGRNSSEFNIITIISAADHQSSLHNREESFKDNYLTIRDIVKVYRLPKLVMMRKKMRMDKAVVKNLFHQK